MIALLLVLSNPVLPAPVEDVVDFIELNHFCVNSELHQMIFWKWDKDRGRFDVVDYRIWKSEQKPELLRGEYHLTWHDPVTNHVRHVRAKGFIQTDTQFDPEMKERATRPKDFREGLLDPGAFYERKRR